MYYHSTAECSSCSTNPLTGESMDSNCNNCDGTGLVYTAKTKKICGITKDFVTKMGQYDPTRGKYEFLPVGDSRITCELEPFLVDPATPSGDTIFEEIDYLQFEGKKYKVEHHDYVPIGDYYICVITLDRYSGRYVKL